MKPFLLSILKCPRCPFTTKLHLSAKKVSKVQVDTDTGFLESRKGYFVDRNAENLKSIAEGFEKAEGDFYSVPTCEAEKEIDMENLNLFLLGNKIEQGSLTCEECKEEYPITNSILRFLK